MIERYQLIQNLVWSGWYSLEGAMVEADRLDLSELDPNFPLGSGDQDRPPKYGHNVVPHLFDNADGIAPQLASYVATQERFARHERGDDDAAQLSIASEFNARGVARICNGLLDEIERGQVPRRGDKGRPKDGGAKAKNWCYALHIYCANHGERATPELLHLTFQVLNCAEMAPPVEMRRQLGLAEKPKKRPQFLQAIELDAEYWARHGRQRPEKILADLVGVDRTLIRRHWRPEAEYQRRLRFAIGNWLSALESAGEPTAREEIDFAAMGMRKGGSQSR